MKQAKKSLVVRGSHELDGKVGRRFSCLRQGRAWSTLHRVDGLTYIDLCLGEYRRVTDMPHNLRLTRLLSESKAARRHPAHEDSIWVAEELQRRFGLAYWQTALTRPTHNRFFNSAWPTITGRSAGAGCSTCVTQERWMKSFVQSFRW